MTSFRVEFKAADAYSGPDNRRALGVNSTAQFYRIDGGEWYVAEIVKSAHKCKLWLEVCDTPEDFHEVVGGRLFV